MKCDVCVVRMFLFSALNEIPINPVDMAIVSAIPGRGQSWLAQCLPLQTFTLLCCCFLNFVSCRKCDLKRLNVKFIMFTEDK